MPCREPRTSLGRTVRRPNREEVCAVFDIAPTLVGILDHATFSNVTEQMRGFYRDTMAPVLEGLQSVLNHYLAAQFDGLNIVRFDVADVIRGDYEHRVDAATKGVINAIMTPNEARELLGLNRFGDPKADELFVNMAVQKLGTPPPKVPAAQS